MKRTDGLKLLLIAVLLAVVLALLIAILALAPGLAFVTDLHALV